MTGLLVLISSIACLINLSVMYSISTGCKVKPVSTFSRGNRLSRISKVFDISSLEKFDKRSFFKSEKSTGSRLIASQYIISFSKLLRRLKYQSNKSLMPRNIVLPSFKN